MATIVEGNVRSFKAGSDLSAKQYYIVKLSSGNIVLAAAGTDKLVGVLEGIPKANDTGDVRLRSAAGTLKVIAGGTVAAGDAVTSDSAGKAITTTTSGDQILGYALQAAVSGDIFEVMPSVAKY